MLGSSEKIDYKMTDEGLVVNFPKNKPTEYAHVFKIKLKGVVVSKPLYDKVDNGCLITVRVANHNAEDANVTLKSVVDGNEVSTQVAVKAKSEQWVKMQNKDVNHSMICLASSISMII